MSVELSKSEKIHQLVQQVKAGELSKSDLFAHLSSLQKGQKSITPISLAQPEEHERSNKDSVVNVGTEESVDSSDFESESEEEGKEQCRTGGRQRVLVEHLFEQKRRKRLQHELGYQKRVEEDEIELSRKGLADARPVPKDRQDLSDEELKKSWNTTYQRQGREARRVEQDKIFNKEYTFRPKIHDLPLEYHGSGSERNPSSLPFNRRMEKWIQQKNKQTLKRREAIKQSELDGCTFSPRINSVKPAKCGIKASERLYAYSKSNKLVQLRAEARAREDQHIKETCTFKPKINRTTPVGTRSRYKKAAARRSDSSNMGRNFTDEECTFKPQVNEIPQEMAAARVYVSADIFDRLSRTSNTQSGDQNIQRARDDSAMDVDMFMHKSSREEKRPASAGQTSKARSQPTTPGVDRRQRQLEFEKFLARQNQKEIRRQLKLEQVAKQCTSSHTPKLCKKSLRIASESKPGDFLERVATDALKKENQFFRKKAKAADPECTFKPAITEHARKKPARSLVELSRGDSLRKETNSRLLKLRAEERELAELTFQPKLQGGSGGESKLKVASDPNNYLSRLRKAQEQSATKQRQVMQQMEREELSECTFHPKIHKVPTYVKRIVRSLSLGPDRKKNNNTPKRPEWR